ncbi:MAG: hypothetical protein LBT36_01100 [Oscillospiraceae bacterium]|jgi:hypothetical protein|nr:hypothetical protein [Oscillospiraceae bacterium]
MEILLGILLGLAIGLAHLALLSRYISTITGAPKKDGPPLASAGLGMAQLLLPFAALAVIALVWRAGLLWVGVGEGTGLLAGAVVLFILRRRGGTK